MGWRLGRDHTQRMETSRRTNDAVPHVIYLVCSHQLAVGFVERRTRQLCYAFCAMYLLASKCPRSGVCGSEFLARHVSSYILYASEPPA